MTERDLVNVDLDEEIRKIHSIKGNIRPIRGPNLPAYVEHDPNVDDVGRLSAEALAASYEKAAQEIEGMGETLTGEVKASEVAVMDAVKELERYKAVTQSAVEECKKAAEVYRVEAKELFELVQARAMAADNVRMMCMEMVSKIKTI
jgi:hypothetical protein